MIQMKKKFIYGALLTLFALTIITILFSYTNKKQKEENVDYALLKRTGTSAETDEWKATYTKGTELYKSVEENPTDTKSRIALATLFIREARVSGNYTYYDKAALKYVNDVLNIDSLDFDAAVLKSYLYISQHHFADGLSIAEKACRINPYNSFVYGLLVDGNVEMGNYDAAVSVAQRMIDIRPDIRSYSRVSYLREIYGDYPGAINAMKMAIDAGVPGDEATEWARIQLAHLFENTGDIKKAEVQYQTALAERPDYPFALSGQAKLAAFKKDYAAAISMYEKASSLITDASIKEALADVYRLSGDTKKSQEMMKNVIDEMNQTAQSGQNDASIGHYVDKELAYAYIKTGDYDKAIEHAILEYNRRPENIDVNEALAWAYYNKGDYSKAIPYIQTALKTKSVNPTLLCYAGLIYAKAGDKTSAKSFLQKALQNHPVIAADLLSECAAVLKTL
jgi:tetratricopeptide (TPR) repeat protein